MPLHSLRAVYNAGSLECFGEIQASQADEKTISIGRRSPYAVAKLAALLEAASYRESYGLFASSGILFKAASPLRPGHF